MFGHSPIVDVEFDQRLDVLGDERDRRDEDGLAVRRCPGDGFLGRRSDPLQRTNARLVADLDLPVGRQARLQRRGGALDLPLVWIAGFPRGSPAARAAESRARTFGGLPAICQAVSRRSACERG